jgi:C4-dicarboxylate transporter, DctM subunit
MMVTTVVVLLVLVFSGVAVAAVLGDLSLILDQIYMHGRLSKGLGGFIWGKSQEFILVAVPMFILLGELTLRAGTAARMYSAVVQWLSWLPGGLMHANIGSCAIFAASSGSSVATAATVGTVAYPEIARHKYNESLFLGSLAAGGTLGILIPPSIMLVLYGLLTDTSVPELYLAGIIPGVILASLFMATITVACMVRRDWGGTRIETSMAERMRTLPHLLPPLLLFVAVVGSIYAGLATPTEAAAIGVVFALVLAAWYHTLTWEMLFASFESTMRTTAMIMLIVLTSVFLNFVLGFIGVTRALTNFISELGLSPMQTMLVVVVFYLLLGMVMETFAMVLTTIPLIFPIVVGMGFDPVWFGILVTVLMEAGLITPPIGVNLYVVHGIREGGGKFHDVAIGAAPFVLAMLLMVALLMGFPEIATWLPKLVY